jgi:hypothetical protein
MFCCTMLHQEELHVNYYIEMDLMTLQVCKLLVAAACRVGIVVQFCFTLLSQSLSLVPGMMGNRLLDRPMCMAGI